MEMFLVFVFGLVIGSFLNVVICRLAPNQNCVRYGTAPIVSRAGGTSSPSEPPLLSILGLGLAEGGSIVLDRSRCPKCGHTLSWYELVPVASFLVQRTRCRACGEKISWQYPLVELITAFLFAFIYNFLPAYYHGWETAYLFAVWSSLLVIFVFDLKHYIIPNKVLYPLVGVVAVHAFFGNGFMMTPHALFSAIGAAGFFLALYLASRGRWIGFGDVKFGIFMGLFLGFPLILVAFFFSYFIGAVIGSVMLMRHFKTLQSEIPFGPFLVLGTFIAYFYGNTVIQWYLNIF
ncbi:prepilin peptidase [Candidatus Azambacteria bacterium]|nr:prepilin peptidase [Candidatus Azambacteria bacterium]